MYNFVKTGTLSLNLVGDKFFFKGDDEISQIISISFIVVLTKQQKKNLKLIIITTSS